MNPLKLASIREGVVDFGIATQPFLPMRPNVHEHWFPAQRLGARHTQPSQEHIGGLDGVLRSDLRRDVVAKKRGSSGAEGGISLWDDSFGFEEPHEIVVGVIQVKLELTSGGNVESINPLDKSAVWDQGTDLINGGDDGGVRQDLLQLLLGKV